MSAIAAQRVTDRRRSRPPAAVHVAGKTIAVTLVAFILIYSALAVASYIQKSATWDEPIHLADGYASLAARDHRVDPEHPPLLRMWAAMPLIFQRGIAFDSSVIDASDPTDWASRDLFAYTHRFTYVDNDADRMLYKARFMNVLLGVVLGLLIFCWSAEWFGFATAAAALGLYVLEPNLMAHASLVTTDLGVTLSVFGAIYFLWRTVQRTTPTNVAVFVLFTTVAVASKFSALVLFPIVALLLTVAVVWLRRLQLHAAAALLALMLATALVGIWGVYSFRYAPSSSAGWVFALDAEPGVRETVPAVAKAAAWINGRRWMPNGFTEGFVISQAKAQRRSAFLAGEYSSTGWWYYFPIALLIKTPVTMLLLAFAGFLIMMRRPDRLPPGSALFLLVPAGVYLGAAMTSNMNIGVRHVLPVYPFLLMLAVAGMHTVVAARRTIVLALIGMCAAFEFASAYPHTLAFFNVLVGGPGHGSEYLVDSNLDWGQDLKPLKKWMDRHEIRHINLAYFGSADPAYYGIDCTYLPGSPSFVSGDRIQEPRLPGYVAVSATVRSGVYSDARLRSLYAPFQTLTPVTTIGHSIFVYWMERPWW